MQITALQLVLGISILALCSSFSTIRGRGGIVMKSNNHHEKNGGFDGMKNAISSIPKKLVPAILGSALLFSNPSDSSALPSGGRSGGSSFRSSSPRASTRSYSSGGGYSGSTMSRSYSYSAPIMPIMPTPMFSPFSYGYGFGFSPFSFMPINLNLIVLGLVAYTVYNALQNRAGGSDFFSGEGEDSGSLGSGASVLKLQLSLDADWADANNIMDTLSNLASRSDSISGRRQLASLLSDASIALLRRQSEWNSAAIESSTFDRRDAQRAEAAFQKIAIQERTKFETETNGGADGRMEYGQVMFSPRRPTSSTPTQAVVSIVVAMRGRSDATRRNNLSSPKDVRDCLQTLASEALSDEGENVLAVEVLWTPSEPGNVVSQRDLVMDYPELIKI